MGFFEDLDHPSMQSLCFLRNSTPENAVKTWEGLQVETCHYLFFHRDVFLAPGKNWLCKKYLLFSFSMWIFSLAGNLIAIHV